MDSQNNSFSSSPSGIDPEEARRRFLDSMGLGDVAEPTSEIAVAETTSVEDGLSLEIHEEEVALSSGPDDLELPGASPTSPVRSFAPSEEVSSESPAAFNEEDSGVSEETEVEVVVEDEAAPAEAPVENEEKSCEKSEEMDRSDVDENELLQLKCPKCDGDLVLMHEHLGIEGACVWCETKIVAARSGMDGTIRVFPLFQPDLPTAKEPAPSEPEPAVVEEVSSEEIPEAKVEAAEPEIEAEEKTAGAEPEPVSEKEEAVTEPFPNSWSGAFEPATTPKAEDESPAAVASEEKAPAEVPDGFGAFSGFSNEAAPEAVADPVTLDTEAKEIPSGFGEGFSSESFKDSAAAPRESEAPEPEMKDEPAASNDFSAGFTDAPAVAGFSESPFSAETTTDSTSGQAEVETPAADQPSGFSGAEAWGPPTPVEKSAAPEVSPDDAVPKAIDEPAPAASGFAAAPTGFDVPAAPTGFDAVSTESEATAAPFFGETKESAPLWDKPTSEAAPAEWGAPAAEETPAPAFSEAPAPAEPKTEATSPEFSPGFAISSSDHAGFSEDAAIPTQATEKEDIFAALDNNQGADEAEPAPSWGDSPPLEATSDPAAASDAKVTNQAPPLFPETTDQSSDSLFGMSPADTEEPLLEMPPPIPETTPTGSPVFSAAPAATGSPTVTSQPLGSKSSKRRGKGMVVFLVILLGLVCGAALASFVLPVDEYVEQARAFVEQKLASEPAVDPAAFISDMVSPASDEGVNTTPPAE